MSKVGLVVKGRGVIWKCGGVMVATVGLMVMDVFGLSVAGSEGQIARKNNESDPLPAVFGFRRRGRPTGTLVRLGARGSSQPASRLESSRGHRPTHDPIPEANEQLALFFEWALQAKKLQ